jgi:hypothetical protein
MVTAMRTVFFRIFVCYVNPVKVALYLSSINLRAGPYWLDCWDAHPI